ncbi:MAG: hypothetical protein GY795_22145 [Desulfobacterales bacterium]|nr:hypothetical protein [Desulfobacterales bacterium]
MEINKSYHNNQRAVLFAIFFCMFAVLFSSPAHAKEPLLIIRTEGKDFEQAVQGMREELEEDFSINEMVIDKKASAREITRKMKNVLPRTVVLMDNISISLYQKYQRQLPNSADIVPSVSLMASFIDFAVKGLKSGTGILYEVPIVTSVVNLRSVLTSDSFDKVGVVHRDFMRQHIKTNMKYCKKEGIKLITYRISRKSNIESELESGLNKLKKKRINALWVPNDSKIVNAATLRSVWIPFAAKFKKPIIVGVEVLVTPKFNFGTFAVIPDHVRLGEQAAEIVFDIMDNDWQVGNRPIEPPRSVYKIINLKQAERLFKIDKERLANVDKILK